MKSLPLNRSTAPQVIRLFDYCFKMGVIDAAEYGDDYTVREWLDARLEDGKYGLLSDYGMDYDWKRWRFTLFRWCRLSSLRKVGEHYIDRIRKPSNFLFAVIPITFRFYLMGIQEWLDYPNPMNMTIFKNTTRMHWKPVAQKMKIMNTDDFVSYVQEFVYERQQHHYEDDIPQSQYDSFAVAIWKFTRKYIPYGDIRDDIEAEEDF